MQAKLKIGAPNDKYEQEADRVADQVMRMPEPQVQRRVEEEEEKMLQAKSDSSQTPELTPGTAKRINSFRGGGQPIDPTTRSFMEPRFGNDFSNVRVHTGTEATQATGAVHAQAFTLGKDIVFGAGKYVPATNTGRQLLAHELTHVIQQNNTNHFRQIQKAPGPDPEPEKEKEDVSLGTGNSELYEIVLGVEPFRIQEMTPPVSRSFRARVEEYGVYPNLNSGGNWALLIPTTGNPPPGGNCLGYAKGEFGIIRPEKKVWDHGEALRAQGASGRDVWDLYMKDEFNATPADGDAEATFALYGRGFVGPGEGPAHIASRVKGGSFWLSKPSEAKPPVLHQYANQMVGGQNGEVIRYYKSETGPTDKIYVKRKQESGTNETESITPNE